MCNVTRNYSKSSAIERLHRHIIGEESDEDSDETNDTQGGAEDNSSDHENVLIIEKVFRDKISDEFYDASDDEININICCNEDEELLMTDIKNNILRKISSYDVLSDRDIYRVLIFIYY